MAGRRRRAWAAPAGSVVLDSLSFCLPGKLLISPSNLNESIARQSVLGSSFHHFKCITPFLSMLFVTLPLLGINTLFLPLISVGWITMHLGVFLLGFILPGTLCFLDLFDCFLSHVREVFSY